MKIKLPKLAIQNKFVVALSAVVSVALFGAGFYLLVIPRYESWQEISAKNKLEEGRLGKIKVNTAFLKGLDETSILQYNSLVTALLPGEADNLRVVSLIGLVMRNSGLALESFTITNASQIRKTTQAAASPASTTPKADNTSQQQTVKPKAAGYTVNFTAHGPYQNGLSFIRALEQVKRVVGVSSIAIAKSASAGEPKIDFSFSLPLGKEATSISPEQKVSLSKEEEDLLNELTDLLTVDVAPSTQPLGKPDPFR